MRQMIYIARESDDPICMRVSLGGPPEGFYCVYRFGPDQKLSEIVKLVKSALVSLERKLEEETG